MNDDWNSLLEELMEDDVGEQIMDEKRMRKKMMMNECLNGCLKCYWIFDLIDLKMKKMIYHMCLKMTVNDGHSNHYYCYLNERSMSKVLKKRFGLYCLKKVGD